MSETTTTPENWFMYHGNYNHGGNSNNSPLTKENVNDKTFGLLHSIETPGSILSVPAIVDGFIYVGLANSHEAVGSNGGTLQKYNIETGKLVCEFTWSIETIEKDTHGFTGMGCTPTVIGDYLYFVGFDAFIYCLNTSDLTLAWSTDLRREDYTDKNQPITNIFGTDEGAPQTEGWSSPLVINMGTATSPELRVFLGIGEGENPELFSFIYCLDATNGKVVWVQSTSQYEKGKWNQVNQIPAATWKAGGFTTVPDGFTSYDGDVYIRGCSVWSAIAYDAETGSLYAGTGQPALPTDNANYSVDQGLPTIGWSSGILKMDAKTGEMQAFTQMPSETSYRKSDLDVDIGSAPTIYTMPASATNPSPRRVVAIPCKNGAVMVCDASTLELINAECLLPFMNNGEQIPTVDPHPSSNDDSDFPTNAESNNTLAENFSGPFNTAAISSDSKTLFVGIGGPNYHSASPGIDYENTPFMRAIDSETLKDVWPMTDSDPKRYSNVGASMYTSPGEAGLSSPAVVNDVVFMSTSRIAIYAFDAANGTLLWSDNIGKQTGGFQGGYGYCLGPAIYGKYVVAGSLVASDTGGVLNIYGLK